MAKFLKNFVLGRKPPLPPTKDYDNGTNPGSKQPGAKHAHFTSKPCLQQDYTNPLDFVNEVFCEGDQDSESVYMLPTEENVYSEPYESQSELSGNLIRSEEQEDVYDEVSAFDEELCVEEGVRLAGQDPLPVDYDEPLEWGPQHGSPISSSSSQCTEHPTLNYDGSSSGNLLDSESSRSFEFCEEHDMPIRHIYETAFDSKVKRETEDIDRLTQSPVLHGESSSSTSSPGSAGRETRVKAHNARNGHHHHHHHHHTRKSAVSPALVIAGPSTQPPELPKPKLPKEVRTERRVPVPERTPPPKPNSLPNQLLKIKAIIEPVRSYSSSSSSSLEEQKNPNEERSKVNGNKGIKARSAMADELTSVLKSRLKMSLEETEDPPEVTDNNNVIDNRKPERPKLSFDSKLFKGVLAEIVANNSKVTKQARTPNGTKTSYEICPKCCQPIVAEQKKTSRSKSMETVTSFSIKSNVVSDPVILCKCSLGGPLQSPENDTRPLTDYDIPWDIPKRMTPRKPSSTLPILCSVDVKDKEEGPPPLKLNFQDFDRNSAPAALNKLGAEPKTNETLLLIPKSPSETQIAPLENIFQGTKPKLNGLGVRKNLNLNFNTTAPPNKNMRQSLALNFGCAALAVKGEAVDPSIPLEEQGWYHGSISRIDAENSLRVLKEGSYLVRNSESSKQDYSLSLKSAKGFMHMKIVNKEGQYILGQYSKPFNSIPEMINHYSDNKLPIRGAEHMSLLYPVIGQLL